MTVTRGARTRRPGLSAAFALLGALILAASVPGITLAGGSGSTIVRGTQHFAGSCENGGYAMTGALEGCWWIDTFEVKTDESKSHFRGTGTEHFTGWIGSVYGTFYTEFSYTAKTDGPWPTAAEIHGRCHHPIVGGEGGFAGISGVINFTDVVDVNPPYYPYWGAVRLP